jgi:hypothetical protein
MTTERKTIEARIEAALDSLGENDGDAVQDLSLCELSVYADAIERRAARWVPVWL